MEAAVHCLAHFGYAGTNAVTVAEQAGMMRSALLYHFPTRLALVEAAIHYVTRRRIAMFTEAMDAIEHGPDWIAHAIEMAWRQTHTVEYCAYGELANAARTDPDLAGIFAPAMDEYDRARRASALTLFTASEQAAAGFHLQRDITRFLLDGLANGWITERADDRTALMLEFLKTLALTAEGKALLEKTVERSKAQSRRTERKQGKKRART